MKVELETQIVIEMLNMKVTIKHILFGRFQNENKPKHLKDNFREPSLHLESDSCCPIKLESNFKGF